MLLQRTIYKLSKLLLSIRSRLPRIRLLGHLSFDSNLFHAGQARHRERLWQQEEMPRNVTL